MRIRDGSGAEPAAQSAGTQLALAHEPRSQTRTNRADLMKRVFEITVLICPHCGGPRRLMAFPTDGLVVRGTWRRSGHAPGFPCNERFGRPVYSAGSHPPAPDIPLPMKIRLVALLMLAALAGACRSGAQSAPVPAPEQPAAAMRLERIEAVDTEYHSAVNDYSAAIHAAVGDKPEPTREDFEKAFASVKAPDYAVYTQRAQALLDEDATDLAALRTIRWMLENGRQPESAAKMFELLEKHHLARPEMGEMCPLLAQQGRGVLEKLVAGSPHAEVRGRALMSLAESLKNDAEMVEMLQAAKPEDAEGLKQYLGAERYQALQHFDAAQNQKQIEQIYERTVKEYSDVAVDPGTKRATTLGKQAAAALFAMRNLSVGNTAPEIEGVDMDDVAFKLSDYRGKVVLLDFWGNW